MYYYSITAEGVLVSKNSANGTASSDLYTDLASVCTTNSISYAMLCLANGCESVLIRKKTTLSQILQDKYNWQKMH